MSSFQNSDSSSIDASRVPQAPTALAVIVPVHNEAENIKSVYHRLATTLDASRHVSTWTVLFINNASTDLSLKEIKALQATDPRIQYVTMARNFGYHASLVAGLSLVEADRYAIIDGDGEDPPEMLSTFLEALENGSQLAYGIRSNREEPRFITLARKIFYRILRKIADGEIVEWMA